MKHPEKQPACVPVVLFSYNRPMHTRRAIEALKKNPEAAQTDLYLYSDGAKKPETQNAVQEVRDYLHGVTGFASVYVVEREKNYGLAANIIDGVTQLVNEYGKVIVLEDDIVVTPYFLDYMNRALTLYEKESSVMAVSSYLPPIEQSEALPESFFLPWFDCWGWGTWSDAWAHFERDPGKLLKTVDADFIRKVNVNGSKPHQWQQVVDNANHRIVTWAVFFYIAILQQNGLVLHPNRSLCINEGMDGSGSNSGIDRRTDHMECMDHPVRQYPDCPSGLHCNEQAMKLVEAYERKANTLPPLAVRIRCILREEGMKGILARIARVVRYYLPEKK